MYLEHFELRELPFTLTPNIQFFCQLPEHDAALDLLLFSIGNGESFIKIIGEVGSGKTLLCRKLLHCLANKGELATTYIANPDVMPGGLSKAIARQLKLDLPHSLNPQGALDVLAQRLLTLHTQNKQIVLIIDEAQALPDESLAELNLLANLDTNSAKLLHIVLFAQSEFNERLSQPSFRQLKQRITFSHYLHPIDAKHLDAYLYHRLATAGYTKKTLFTEKAKKLLYRNSHGVPRLINMLCHKAMIAAYGFGERMVDVKAMKCAIKDSELAQTQKKASISDFSFVLSLVLLGLIILTVVANYPAYKVAIHNLANLIKGVLPNS